MDRNNQNNTEFFELIKLFVLEDKLRFIIFSLYFFGITKDYFYYSINNINILEYSSLYDFLISPFSDFLLLTLLFTFLVIFFKKRESETAENQDRYQRNFKVSDIFRYGFILVITLIVMLSLLVILIILTNLSWINITSIILLGVLFYFLEMSLQIKDNKGIVFLYITIFAFYCIVNPLLQTLYINTGTISKGDVAKLSFEYENKKYNENENHFLLGTNSKYIFVKEIKSKKALIIPKEQAKNILYSK